MFPAGGLRGIEIRFGKIMDRNHPRLSVVVPTFNRAHCLGETLESIVSQSYRDFELIVVDDGSTDATGEVVQRFAKARYLRLSENAGVSHARNRGIALACGEFICFLDSDDLWLKDKLERQIEWMDAHPECTVCYTDEIWIRNGVRVNPMKKHGKYSGDIFRHCLPLCIVSPSSVLMRASLFEEVGRFDESLPACEDYDLWLRIALRHPFHFIDARLIVKRGGHADQLSAKHWGMDRFRVRALEKLLQRGDVLSPERRGWVLDTLKQKCGVLIQGALKRGNHERADEYRDLLRRHGAVPDVVEEGSAQF